MCRTNWQITIPLTIRAITDTFSVMLFSATCGSVWINTSETRNESSFRKCSWPWLVGPDFGPNLLWPTMFLSMFFPSKIHSYHSISLPSNDFLECYNRRPVVPRNQSYLGIKAFWFKGHHQNLNWSSGDSVPVFHNVNDNQNRVQYEIVSNRWNWYQENIFLSYHNLMFESYYTALEFNVSRIVCHMISHVIMSQTFDFCSGWIVASKFSYLGIDTISCLFSHTFWNSIRTLFRTIWPVRPFRPIAHSSSFTIKRIEDLVWTVTVWSAITLKLVSVKRPLGPTTKSINRCTGSTTATYWTTLKIFQFWTPKWAWARLIFIIWLK